MAPLACRAQIVFVDVCSHPPSEHGTRILIEAEVNAPEYPGIVDVVRDRLERGVVQRQPLCGERDVVPVPAIQPASSTSRAAPLRLA